MEGAQVYQSSDKDRKSMAGRVETVNLNKESNVESDMKHQQSGKA